MNNVYIIPNFVEIPEKLYQTAYDNAWSYESMEGHGAEGRTLKYMGGRIMKGDRIFNYHLDDQGDWWYKELAIDTDKGIVPMEDRLFGSPETRKTDSQGRRKKRYEGLEQNREDETEYDGSWWGDEDLLSEKIGP